MCEKFSSFIEKKGNIDFYNKNNRKQLAIAVKYMKDGENRISFIKDVEITYGRADTINSALSNNGVELKAWADLKMMGQ